MRKILIMVLAAVLTAFPQRSAAEPEKVHVGVILPLTGETASLGQALKNGIEMGFSRLSPEIRERLVLSYEDDGFQPKNSLSAFYKLRSEGKADILINVSSGTGKALAPVVEQRKVPMISIASDTTISAGRTYPFNFWVTPAVESRLLIPDALKSGYKRVARIVTQHDGAISIAKSFDAENGGRIEVVLDEAYPLDQKDFRPFLTRLRTVKADAVVVVLLPGQCGLFAKQAKEAGFTLPLLGYEIFEDRQEVELSGGALIGQRYVSSDDPDQTFLTEYRSRYPNASQFLASNGNDAVLLIGKAVEQGVAAAEFHTFLRTLKDFSGVLGTYSAAGDNTFTLPAAMKVVTKDGFEKAKG